MAIEKEYIESIKYPESRKYPKEMFEFLVSEVVRDQTLTTDAVARMWIVNNNLPEKIFSAVRTALYNFRAKYAILNEVDARDREKISKSHGQSFRTQEAHPKIKKAHEGRMNSIFKK